MHAYHVLSISVAGVSLLTMTAISVDRLLALHYHLRYLELMTKQRALYAATSIWVIVFTLSFIFVWNQTIAFFAAVVAIVPCIVVSTFCLRKNLSNCSASSDTDSCSTAGCGKFKYGAQSKRGAVKEKRHEHFYILHLSGYMLFPSVRIRTNESDFPHTLDNSVDLNRYCDIHELFYKSIFILLA